MPVTSAQSRIDVVGTGSVSTFAIPFMFFNATDLTVILTDSTASATSPAVTPLAMGTDYIVAGMGVASGGSITMLGLPTSSVLPLPPTSLQRISVLRQPAYVQLTVYPTSGPFPAASHQNALDLLTMECQALAEEQTRALTLPANMLPSTANSAVPTPISGSVLGWVSGAWVWLSQASVTLAANLLTAASGMGTSLIIHLAPFTGAIGRLLVVKLGETVSVTDFGADPTGVNDSTAAINAAITAAVGIGKYLHVPAGTYKIIPATPMLDAAGTNYAAFVMASGLRILAEPGAVFKIASGVSTDASPKRMSMFFSNSMLSDISFDGLTMDMNGANNTISPSRPSTYALFTQAHILFSSAVGVNPPAGASNVRIERCKFLNTAGATCIGMAQTNLTGTYAMGSNWSIKSNLFSNNGTDTNDHSSIYGYAHNVECSGNEFTNPAPCTNTIGGQCVFEVHGDNCRIHDNHILNYYRAIYVSSNTGTAYCVGTQIHDNVAKIQCRFVEFWAQSAPESTNYHVDIHDNNVEFTADTVPDTFKSLVTIACNKLPFLVNVHDNVVRNYSTTQNAVLVNISINSTTISTGGQYYIKGNVGAGLAMGMAIWFNNATINTIGAVEFSNNRLGALQAIIGGWAPSSQDIYIYGPQAGTVAPLRVYGLESPLPIITDGAAGGRATVYGKAILNATTTWANVTVGNGATSTKLAIDTDAGHAIVDLYFSAGSTSSCSGQIAATPKNTGGGNILSANANSACSALVKYGATAYVMAGAIDNTGNWITPVSNSGNMSNTVPAAFTTSTNIWVAGLFPCASASI